MNRLAVGHRLGHYEVEAALGSGGMGEVYRARDCRLGRLVAIKILSQELAGDPDARARFDREARVIAALTHPHICRLYDVGHEQGIDFLVMEHLTGRSLAERLASGPMPVDDALAIALQIAAALGHAHRHGIVHRDLKPANVMLTSDGAKLMDFGLAKPPMPIQSTLSAAETVGTPGRLTEGGVILGTIAYMSPEQAVGRPVGFASDVFSFGVVLHEMLTGQSAFARPTAVETLAAIVRDAPEPLRAIGGVGIGKMTVLRKTVEHCLSKEPDDRPRSMDDVKVELEEAAGASAHSPASVGVSAGERRMVTAMTVHVSPHSPDTMSPERLKHALDRAFSEIDGALLAEGGVIEHHGGGIIHALFGASIAHADDPERALRAGDACIRSLEVNRHGGVPLIARIGIETGEAIVDPRAADLGHGAAVGACVSAALRLQELAEPGQILVGPTCRAATADAADFVELPDLEIKAAAAVGAARLAAMAAKPRGAHLPLVGRDTELGVLRFAYRRARSGHAVLVVISGPPGQGKSRLLEELVSELRVEAQILQARCRPVGEVGAPGPLVALLSGGEGPIRVEQLEEQLAMRFADPLEQHRVFQVLAHSAGLRASRELSTLPREQLQDEIANGWRRYLIALSRHRPVVMWVDDLHWADADVVRLLDRITFGSKLPIFVVTTARPEFQPQTTLRSGADRFFITLDALDDDAARRLAGLAGASDAGGVERAEGNPLFIIELTRSRSLQSRDVPVTLQGVIGERLDELSTRDRDLLQRAAIVGETFTARDVTLLSGREPGEVSRAIDRLTDLLFLLPAPGGLRFHHALVRDVAYGRLTIGDRMRLHARYAREVVPAENVEALAHHLGEAVGSDDSAWVWGDGDELTSLRTEAGAAHLSAARGYAARSAYERAIDMCRRAFRFSTSKQDEAQVEATLADIYSASGEADEGATHYLLARELCQTNGMPVPADLYPSFLEHVVYTSGMFRNLPGQALVDDLLREGEAAAERDGDVSSRVRIAALRAYRSHNPTLLRDALRDSERVPDPAPLTPFLSHAAILHHRVGKFSLARQAYERLDAVAKKLGRTDRQLEFRAILALNTGDLADAARLADDFVAATASRGPHLRTHASRELAHVLLARGDWPALRDLAARTDQLVTDHPDTAFCYAVTTTRAFGLVACALEGDAAGARALLPHVETPLQAEPFERESLLALVYGALGRRDALHALADPLNPPGTPFWFFQRTYVVALTMLEAWEDLEAVLPPLERVAGEGSPYLAALLEAIREEVAEARGAGPPAHDTLRRLGYEGWSQLLSHRPRL